MAASSKKGKIRWKQLDTAQIINSTSSRKITSSSWADESNDPDDPYDFGRKAEVTLPTAPRAARGPENDAKIPQEPPFQAYLSNLSYEVTEDDLAEFFSNLRVKSVRLPRDDRGNSNRAKGFGYIEFDDRNSLIEALSMPDTNLKNRRMRIEVAEGDQGRGGRGGPRDHRGPNEPDRTMGDWRSGPRSESDSLSSDRDGYRSGPKRDYGGDRGGTYGDRRGGRDDDRDRGGFRRDGGFRDNRGFRDDNSGGMYRDSDRYERRGFDDRRDDRRDFGDRRPDYGGGGDRGSWRRDNDTRMEKEPSGDFDKGEPKTRTKLNLQPRTRPVEERVNGDMPANNVPASPSAATAASIFGGAKPVDTSAREREIEERLAKQRDERLPPAREESKISAQTPVRGDSLSTKEDVPTSPSLEPAPPPKENVWARRSQQVPSQVNIGRISPHEEGDSQKNRNTSPSNEPRKYQPPRRYLQDDRRRDERNAGLKGGGSTPRGGSGLRQLDTRQSNTPQPKEQKKETSDETIKMAKVQNHTAPNFVGSNKYAFLEDSESFAD